MTDIRESRMTSEQAGRDQPQMNTDETQISHVFRGQPPRRVKNLPQIPSAPIYADSRKAITVQKICEICG